MHSKKKNQGHLCQNTVGHFASPSLSLSICLSVTGQKNGLVDQGSPLSVDTRSGGLKFYFYMLLKKRQVGSHQRQVAFFKSFSLLLIISGQV